MAALVAVAVIVVVVVAVVVALVAVSRDGGDPQNAAAAGETTSSGESTVESSTTATSTSASAGADSSSGRCADEELRVAVKPAEPNVQVGKDVIFYAEITNTSKKTCDRDLSGAPLAFEVYNLEDNSRVWSSVDCTQSDKEDVMTLKPNATDRRQIAWTGRASAPGACGQKDRAPAPEGAYQVYALVGNAFSPAATFNLTPAS